MDVGLYERDFWLATLSTTSVRPDGIGIGDLWPCHLMASRSTLKANKDREVDKCLLPQWKPTSSKMRCR